MFVGAPCNCVVSGVTGTEHRKLVQPTTCIQVPTQAASPQAPSLESILHKINGLSYPWHAHAAQGYHSQGRSSVNVERGRPTVRKPEPQLPHGMHVDHVGAQVKPIGASKADQKATTAAAEQSRPAPILLFSIDRVIPAWARAQPRAQPVVQQQLLIRDLLTKWHTRCQWL